jgi:hypothetical protein
VKKWISLLIFVISVFLIIGQGCNGEEPQTSKNKGFEPFSFAIITDIHVGRNFSDYGAQGWADYDLTTGQAIDDNEGDFNYVTDRLMAVVDWLNANYKSRNIKFLVILGDIADSAEMSEFFRAKKILDNLEIPYVPLIGNHDVWSNVKDPNCLDIQSTDGELYFERIFWRDQHNKRNIDRLKALFGDSWQKQRVVTKPVHLLQNYAFSYQGINFVALDYARRDTNCIASLAEPFSETKNWLRDDIQRHNGEIVIVFSHYPYMSLGGFAPQEAGYLSKLAYENSASVLDFGGHIHYDLNVNKVFGQDSEAPVIVTKGLMGGRYDLSADFLRIVKVNGPDIKNIDYSEIITISTENKQTPVPPATVIISCPPVGRPKFIQDQEVITTDDLRVRTEPNLNAQIIKTQPKGTSGKILEGPVCADNYVWWKVKYQDGTTGWSAENWLEILIRTPISSPETPTTPEITPIITPILTVTPTPPTITPPPTIIPFGKCNEEIKENLINWAKEHTCDFPNIAFWFSCWGCPPCWLWSPWYWDSYFEDCDLAEENVWAVGYLPAIGGYGSIVYSPDSGQNWQIQWTSETFGPNPFAVDFLDMNEGFVATDDNIFQTSDGGKTWQEIFRVKSYPGLKDWGVWLREFQVIDRLHLWGRLSEGIVVKTEDGGKSWLCSRDNGGTWQPY